MRIVFAKLKIEKFFEIFMSEGSSWLIGFARHQSAELLWNVWETELAEEKFDCWEYLVGGGGGGAGCEKDYHCWSSSYKSESDRLSGGQQPGSFLHWDWAEGGFNEGRKLKIQPARQQVRSNLLADWLGLGWWRLLWEIKISRKMNWNMPLLIGKFGLIVQWEDVTPVTRASR